MRSFALVAAAAVAAAVVPCASPDAAAKDEVSFGNGLRLNARAVADDEVDKPDAHEYRKVSATLGSAKMPRGQWLFGTFKLKDPKSGAPLDVMPNGQYLALLKLEHFAKDFTNKDGAVSVPAGRYISVGLPAMKKEGREKAEKWATMVDWTQLFIRPEIATPTNAGQFEGESVFRDTVRIAADRWAVISVGEAPVVFVEPLAPKKAAKGETGTKDAAAAEEKTQVREVKITLHIWNPGGQADDARPSEDGDRPSPDEDAPGTPAPSVPAPR